MKSHPEVHIRAADSIPAEPLGPRRAGRVLLTYCAVAIVVFWSLSVVILVRGDAPGLALAHFASGLQGVFLAGYGFARTDRRQWWRWLVMLVGGLGILVFSLVDAVTLDLHGFFELLILGSAGAAIGHTMITTILGPLFFGRILCGWGCWRAMILERLPVGKGAGRRKALWAWTPVAGVGLSLVVAYVAAVDSAHPRAEGAWSVAAGVGVYYAAAIALASALRDQRAFCKYLCPSGFILRWTSRPARLRVTARVEECTSCEECTGVCPMDIPVASQVKIGARIGAGDCILCQRCVEICPTGALKTSFGR